MQANARKMKRTKREIALMSENMNRDAIQRLLYDHQQLIQIYEETMQTIVNYQIELMAIRNILKRRGIVDDLSLAQERTAIQDVLNMEKQALKIGDK
jgi:hypothetical protein